MRSAKKRLRPRNRTIRAKPKLRIFRTCHKKNGWIQVQRIK